MRSPGCLSDLRIDMLLAGDLGVSDEAGARAHAETCAACEARIAEIEAARAASEMPGAADLEALRRAAAAAPALRPRGRSTPWRRLWPTLGAALAAGAAALVLIARAPEPQAPAPEGTRIKGGARLGFFVKHGDGVRRGGPDEAVNPGDLVRFTATSTQPAHLTIIGVDAAGTVSVYFPVNGGADDVPAGEEIELPRATALDETLGSETVYGYFCVRSIDAAALSAALRAHPTATPPPAPAAGCSTDKLVWTKVRAP